MTYDYKYIINDGSEICPYIVKGVGTYKDGVLAGQDKVTFLDCFGTYEEAKAAYPDADLSHALLEPTNTYDHLPDNGDGW